MIRSLSAVLILAAFIAVSGCDSSNPVTQEIPAEMVGNYTFAELRFYPDATQLDDYDVLGTLDSAQTKLTIYETGQFTLSYAFKDSQIRPVNGQVATLNNQLQLAPAGIGQQDRLVNLLFRAPLALDFVAGDRLLTKKVRMITDIYDGIPQVGGELWITLVKVPR